MRFLCLVGLLLSACWAFAAPEEPYALDNLLQRIPPLTHDARGRWPLIAWEPFILSAKDDGFNKGVPLTKAQYQALAARGLAQAIRLTPAYIPIAKALQDAGVPVIAMEGNGGDLPATLADGGAHQLPADYKPTEIVHACPMLLAGWNTEANKLRATLKQFKDAGVTLDAAWLDWENEPIWSREAWEQSRRCPRCQKLFPPGILDDYYAYRDFIVRYRQQLFSTYLAAPIREFYPACSITNWAVVYSDPARRTFHYWGRFNFPPMDAGLFTATNPVAYGNDIAYSILWDKLYPKGTPLDEAHMDRVYTYLMLAQMSDDAANRQAWRVEAPAIPWVCRYCPDMDDPKVPMLSATRYREILRHLWLRGAGGMQIFNAYRPKTPTLRLEEVADAVASLDEALGYRAFLEHGTVMNTSVPEVTAHTLWSGLRLGDEAIVRVVSLDPQPLGITLATWPDADLYHLDAPVAGATYHVTRKGKAVTVEVVK